MSEETASAAEGVVFRPIKTAAGERAHRYRSLKLLTYSVVSGAGAHVLALVLQGVALVGQWLLLARMAGDGFGSRAAMMAAATASDGFVTIAGILGLVTLLPTYILAGSWIYNAACNIRALGARGMQVSPGMAVGWYAVPIASFMMPFQAMSEIYRASGSPIGWQRLKTPALLRFWWGAWLVAGISGYALAVARRGFSGAAELSLYTQLTLLVVAVDIAAAAFFVTIVWRVYRAQAHSQMQVREVAQVFA